MNRVPVLAGSLDETDLVSLLEMLSLSRQISHVELSSPLGALEGSIWLKSGQVLEVSAGSRSGLEAIRYLIERPGKYSVYRAEGKLQAGARPLMSIGDLLHAIQSSDTDTMSDRTFPSLSNTGVSQVVASAPGPQLRESMHQLREPAPAPAPAPAPQVREPARAVAAPPKPREPSTGARTGPVLAVFANKGGVGKTTFALNLAVTLTRRGFRTILVDTDPRNDVGTSLAARRDTSLGVFDVLDGSASLQDVLLETALPGFSVLPAGGVSLSEERFQAASARADALASLLSDLSAPGTMVVVDTPPGLRGITNTVLRASSHALAIVQAEPIALRSAALVPRALDALPATERPALAGVVLNMLDRRVGASLGMLEEACRIFGPEAVFDIAIPRSPVFLEASEQGVPVALLEAHGSHAVGWIFESLASSMLARAGLATPKLPELRLL